MWAMAQGRYSRVERSVHVGSLIRESCREIDMGMKELAITCELDPATLSRGLDGDGSLDLWHLALAPMRFWRVFLMKFTSALIVQWFDERVSENTRRRA
jgi:hypothetical protein